MANTVDYAALKKGGFMRQKRPIFIRGMTARNWRKKRMRCERSAMTH